MKNRHIYSNSAEESNIDREKVKMIVSVTVTVW